MGGGHGRPCWKESEERAGGLGCGREVVLFLYIAVVSRTEEPCLRFRAEGLRRNGVIG